VDVYNYFNIWRFVYATGRGRGGSCKGAGMRSGALSAEAILKESPRAIIDGGGAIVECGGPFKELFGFGEGELIGKDWFDIFPGSEDAAQLKASIEGFKSYSAFTFTFDHHNTGKALQWAGFVFTDVDGGRRVALIAEDVTGCKESGRQLERHMVELERMTRAQSSRELRMSEMRRKISELEKSLVHCKGAV